MSDFIQDFLSFNIGTECPPNFLRWSALSAIGIAAGLRYSLQQGRISIKPNTFMALIGEQGVRKSFAKDQIRALIEEALPDYPIGADITTRDDLVRMMSSDDCERAFTDSNGNTGVIYHPLSLFINELKHFLSYNPSSMISFLVDIYDRDYFRGSTIKRGKEEIERPCLNILACENTDWLINSLKMGIITGGFSRRFIVIYEPDDGGVVIPRPFLPENHAELWNRMIGHLRFIQSNARTYTWDSDAIRCFDSWYHEHKKNMSDDKIIRGFQRTKDQQVLKIAMLTDLADSNPKYKITTDLLELTFSNFNVIEPNMPKLYVAAGRNELAMPQQEMIDVLKLNQGMLNEREFLRKSDKNLNPMEKLSVIRNLIELGYLIKARAPAGSWGSEGNYFISAERFVKEKKLGTNFTLLRPV